jgi:hypothetical protein
VDSEGDLVVIHLVGLAGFQGEVVSREKVETLQFLDINGLGYNLYRYI